VASGSGCRGRAGTLAYYEAGEDGLPLLLVHSVNAALAEVRPLYEC
jgi:hypothetical protein